MLRASFRTEIPRALPVACALPLALAGRALAEPVSPIPPTADPTEPPPDPKTAEAREHFRNAVKLYQDENFTGALAEFEASYALKPTPSTLQNVALSLKALYRYTKAAETLKALVERHGAELDEAERATITQAIDELLSLVGRIAV